MGALDSQDQLVIRLRFWEDMTGPEIAKAMSISPEEKVYPVLQRAIDRLRQQARETYGNQEPQAASVSHRVKGHSKRAS
jgi:DNA-directed RNA polymerase specialized sigma subunit